MAEFSEGAVPSQRPDDFTRIVNIKELSEGQGFFDQRPFRDIFSQYSEVISPEQIGRGLNQLINRATKRDTSGDLNIEDYVYGLYTQPDKFLPRDSKLPIDVTTEVVHGILNGLRDNPLWVTYVKDKFDPGQYDVTGTYHNMTKAGHIKIDTYYNWLFKKAVRDERIRNSALLEQLRSEFPQDFGDGNAIEWISASGKSIPGRDHAAKAAAETGRRR